MRGSYILGTCITLLWILSPVGGQSALRLLNTTPYTVSSNATIRYEPIEASLARTMVGSDIAESNWPLWASTYMTSLRTSQTLENTTRDILGNVRIPKLDTFSPPSGSQEDFIVINQNQTVQYVSLLVFL